MASTFSLQGKLGLDSRDFVRGAKKAEHAIGGVSDDLNELPKTAQTTGSKSGGLLSSGMVKGFAAAGGAAALGAAFKSTITAASDLSESTNAVGVAFGSAGDKVLEFGEDAAESFGMSKTAFNEAAVGFSSFAADIAAQNGGDVADTLNDLMTRATDMASVFNVEVPDAANAMRSALSGEAEPMKQFGIVMSEAKVQAYALSEGIIESGEAMDDAQKMAARYGFIMAETDKVQGDWANTSDGFAGQMKILQAKFTDMQAELGEKLLPAVVAVTEAFIGLVDALGYLDRAFGGDAYVLAFDYVPGVDLEEEIDRTQRMYEVQKLAMEGNKAAQDAFRKGDWSKLYGEAAGSAIKFNVELEEQEFWANNAADALDGVYKPMEDLGDQADDSADAIYGLRDSFKELRHEMSERSAYLDVEDSFQDLGDASEELADTAGKSWAEQQEDARDHERAVMDVKQSVMDYSEEVGGIPDEQLTDIIALIDEDKLWEAGEALAELERDRVANVTVRMTAVDVTTGKLVPRGSVGYRAGGGDIEKDRPYVVGEKGAELIFPDRAGYVATAAQTAALFSKSMSAPAAHRTPVAASSGLANGSGLTINHYGPQLSAADVSRGFTLARLAQAS